MYLWTGHFSLTVCSYRSFNSKAAKRRAYTLPNAITVIIYLTQALSAVECVRASTHRQGMPKYISHGFACNVTT
jgi:hypothetical protein